MTNVVLAIQNRVSPLLFPQLKSKDLARMSLQLGAIYFDTTGPDITAKSTVDTLTRGYVVCPPKLRFVYYTTEEEHEAKNHRPFFGFNSVKYHAELLNYIDTTRPRSLCER